MKDFECSRREGAHQRCRRKAAVGLTSIKRKITLKFYKYDTNFFDAFSGLCVILMRVILCGVSSGFLLETLGVIKPINFIALS